MNFLKKKDFKWKVSEKRHDKNNIGLIAQEVAEQFPDLVHGEGGEDKMSINTLGVVAVLTKALQEAIDRIEVLENA